MLDYLDHIGWVVLHSPAGISYLVEGRSPSAEQLESFIQNWLYFGLLHEVFGEFTDVTKFITENTTHHYYDSS